MSNWLPDKWDAKAQCYELSGPQFLLGNFETQKACISLVQIYLPAEPDLNCSEAVL